MLLFSQIYRNPFLNSQPLVVSVEVGLYEKAALACLGGKYVRIMIEGTHFIIIQCSPQIRRQLYPFTLRERVFIGYFFVTLIQRELTTTQLPIFTSGACKS